MAPHAHFVLSAYPPLPAWHAYAMCPDVSLPSAPLRQGEADLANLMLLVANGHHGQSANCHLSILLLAGSSQTWTHLQDSAPTATGLGSSTSAPLAE